MLTETISRAAREFGSRAAFVTPSGGSLSFEQLELAGREAAAGLQERGLGEGSVVGLVLPSDVDYPAIYLGAARIGAVTAGVNPLLTRAEVTGCLDALDADLVVVDPRLAHLVEDGIARRTEILARGATAAAAGGSIRSPSLRGFRGPHPMTVTASDRCASASHRDRPARPRQSGSPIASCGPSPASTLGALGAAGTASRPPTSPMWAS